MAMRVFSSNPTLPVLAACELCGTGITPKRLRDANGNQWVSGEELVQLWIDHQLNDCIPLQQQDKGVNNEGSICG